MKVQSVEEKRMFGSPFLFPGLPSHGPASIACDDERGNLFHSTGPQGTLHYPHLTQGKSRHTFGG